MAESLRKRIFLRMLSSNRGSFSSQNESDTDHEMSDDERKSSLQRSSGGGRQRSSHGSSKKLIKKQIRKSKKERPAPIAPQRSEEDSEASGIDTDGEDDSPTTPRPIRRRRSSVCRVAQRWRLSPLDALEIMGNFESAQSDSEWEH
eukprot:m.30756 g.30756  ORF g.30756 m.30756 type:complete len:146 (-) comp8235_c0_seq1:161-598(-)